MECVWDYENTTHSREEYLIPKIHTPTLPPNAGPRAAGQFQSVRVLEVSP